MISRRKILAGAVGVVAAVIAVALKWWLREDPKEWGSNRRQREIASQLQQDKREYREPKPSEITIEKALLSPDGHRLLTVFHATNPTEERPPPRDLSLWDADTGKELWGIASHKGVYGMHWLPDSKHALLTGPDGRLAVWDVEKCKLVRSFGMISEGVKVLAVSANGKKALTSSERGNQVWDVEKGVPVSWLHGARGIANSGYLSPDGSRALVEFSAWVGSDHMALYDVEQGEALRIWRHRPDWSLGPFAPDSRRVAVRVRVKRTKERTEYLALREPETEKDSWKVRGRWEAQCFTPDGKQILVDSVGVGGRGVVFGRLDAVCGRPLWSFEINTPVGVTAGSFSVDGGRVALGSGMRRTDGRGSIWLEVWETTREKQLWRLEVPEEIPRVSRREMPGQ